MNKVDSSGFKQINYRNRNSYSFQGKIIDNIHSFNYLLSKHDKGKQFFNKANLPLSSVRSPMSFKPLESVTIFWEEKMKTIKKMIRKILKKE